MALVRLLLGEAGRTSPLWPQGLWELLSLFRPMMLCWVTIAGECSGPCYSEISECLWENQELLST